MGDQKREGSKSKTRFFFLNNLYSSRLDKQHVVAYFLVLRTDEQSNLCLVVIGTYKNKPHKFIDKLETHEKKFVGREKNSMG